MTITRREFLAALGTTAASASMLTTLGCRNGGGGAAAAAARTIPRVGLQLYTVRDAMQRDVPGTLRRVAAIGYREVEFAGYFDHPAAEIRKFVADAGLTAPSAHIPLTASDDVWKRAVDDAVTVGHEFVTIPWLPEDQRRSAADYRQLATRLNALARVAHDAGLEFAYHNHDFEFADVPGLGAKPYDYLLGNTDPALVKYELDLYWITKSGNDPMDYFRRYPTRFAMFHVKDATPAPERAMAPVGQGSIDFAAIFADAARRGEPIEHYFVEHDSPADPFASITTSFGTLSHLTF